MSSACNFSFARVCKKVFSISFVHNRWLSERKSRARFCLALAIHDDIMYKHLFVKFLFVQNVRLETINKYGDQSVGVLSQYLFSLGSFNPDNLVTISSISPLLVAALICSLFNCFFI